MTTPAIDPNTVLTGVWLKLGHGRNVLDILLKEIGRVVETGSASPPQINGDGTYSAIYAPTQEPYPEMGLLLGDFAHCARSALDNLVTVLVLRNGGQPIKDNAFPIYTRRADWKKNVIKRHSLGEGPLANVSQADYDAIEQLQPFNDTSVADPEDNLLAILSRVNNADKHAMLHTAVAYSAPVDQKVLRVSPPTPVEIIWSREPFEALVPGTEQTRYRFVGPAPQGDWVVLINWPMIVQFTDHLGRAVPYFKLTAIYNAVGETIDTCLGRKTDEGTAPSQ
ncbi:hypothetical protein ASG36_14655 [Geodermatophilus sp. Leaf369]|uniref:hypothetical protein n=1 Tax=Geodermatophilus sp. Leaf369 TaxID=1736354 RepID=UPI0006FDE7C1|nr:hypothetical protein [Geodermatophilus sp. Leaf369]KQS57829.1 hypothetical protein ASG36_14655 [Geodermatophilus sp. Leaf369]